MDQATHNKIVSFIWGIADDVLRDLFKRGKYPDVILPMFVIRRMDAVLEPTKQAVLDTKKMLDDARITEQRAALYDAAGQAFYNTSRFTLRDLKSRGSQQQLLADFDDYLNGYSPNVQDILENFKFRNQLSTLSKADALGTLVNKFLDPEIDLSPAGIERISRTFLDFKETPESKIFPNAAFGYWKVTVERPLRLHSQLSLKAIETLRFASGDEDLRATLYDEFGDDLFTQFAKISAALEKRLAEWGDDEDDGDDEAGGSIAKKGLSEKKQKKLLDPKTWERDGRLVETATALRAALGGGIFEDHNIFRDSVGAALKQAGLKLPAADLKKILKAVSWRVETAPLVIAKVHKPGKTKADPLRGLFAETVVGKPAIVEYEPDSDLRDTEQVPLLEDGGIEAFIRREVLPYTPDAWIKQDATRIGYEISFTRHFYKPQPLRTLEEISADILAIEKEAEGLLDGLLKSVTA